MAQPRRDPTREAEAFEASSFPEIIDRIFDAAPYDSHLVLRAVCKSWNQRCDKLLLRHVLVQPYEDPRTGTSWQATTPDGLIPRLKWYNHPELVKGIGHLDMLTTAYPPWAEHIRALDTLRYVPPEGGMSVLLRPSGPTALSNSTTDHALALGVTDHREDVVVCLGVPASSINEDWDPDPLPKSLTFIFFTPPSAITRDLRSLHEYTGPILWAFVCSVAEWLCIASERSLALPINLVNCDSWFPALHGDYGPPPWYLPPDDNPYPFHFSHNSTQSLDSIPIAGVIVIIRRRSLEAPQLHVHLHARRVSRQSGRGATALGDGVRGRSATPLGRESCRRTRCNSKPQRCLLQLRHQG